MTILPTTDDSSLLQTLIEGEGDYAVVELFSVPEILKQITSYSFSFYLTLFCLIIFI